MIHAENLKKKYRTDDLETIALNDVSFSIEEGEFVSIMGPSGCGKSTLLNIIGLLDVPTSGKVRINGLDLSGASEDRRAEVRRDSIGFVFQNFNLIDELDVYENVELPLLYQEIGPRQRKELVQHALEAVQISHRQNSFPKQLSGGQQQRAAVARAIVSQPKLLLADEPTGNLDSHNRTQVLELLTELNEAGTTIVMVTHSAMDAEFGHRIVYLFDGQIVTENHPFNIHDKKNIHA